MFSYFLVVLDFSLSYFSNILFDQTLNEKTILLPWQLVKKMFLNLLHVMSFLWFYLFLLYLLIQNENSKNCIVISIYIYIYILYTHTHTYIYIS